VPRNAAVKGMARSSRLRCDRTQIAQELRRKCPRTDRPVTLRFTLSAPVYREATGVTASSVAVAMFFAANKSRRSCERVDFPANQPFDVLSRLTH
jgi:hypothetical protein